MTAKCDACTDEFPEGKVFQFNANPCYDAEPARVRVLCPECRLRVSVLTRTGGMNPRRDARLPRAWALLVEAERLTSFRYTYRYADAADALARVLGGLAVLSGSIVGPSGSTWQDVASETAQDCRRLAAQLDAAASGRVSEAPPVLPCPGEALDRAMGEGDLPPAHPRLDPEPAWRCKREAKQCP